MRTILFLFIISFNINFSNIQSNLVQGTLFEYLDYKDSKYINLNNYDSFLNPLNNQKHFIQNQYYHGIPVFGRSIRIHFNVDGMPSSLSDNMHQGIFESAIPVLSEESIKEIIYSDFNIQDFSYKNEKLMYYIEDNKGLLVYHIDAISYVSAYRYLVNAHTGLIIRKWTLIHDEGPIIGSGENLLGQLVDTLHIYEGNSFSSVGDLVTPYLVCEQYCWDYGDCDGQNYNDCELSYIQGSCPENYLEDCNGDCFHEWYMEFPGVGNGFCNAPWIDVTEDMISSGDYNMVDQSQSELGNIFTINSYGGFYENLSYVNSMTPIFNSSISSYSHASGVSAHDYQRKTNDYFWNHFGYAGIDGNGKRVVSVINYGTGGGISQNNAFFNAGLDVLSYGIAGGAYRPFCAAQDIVTHEFTHGFTAHHSGLIYANHPGALNESISDVFGYFVEAEYQDGGDWTEGEDIRINGGASRSFENPPIYGDPDNINHSYYTPPTDNPNMFTNDFGGVHSNSGIPNKVLYLVVQGDEHYGINVSPFEQNINNSRDVASAIWYNWNRYYLESEDDFFIAREKMLQVSHDLYPDKPLYFQTVSNAWASVGVGNPLFFGDLNNDYIVNIQDIILLIGIIIGNYQPDEQQLYFADINQDQVVDILDVVLAVNIIFS